MNTMGAIHAALRDRSIDKDDARDRFERVTGLRSLKAMDEDQRRAVLKDLNSDGFKGTSKGARKTLTGPYAKKLQALWIAGWNLGLVRNRDDKALLAFVKRQTGLDHTQFLHDAANAAKVIEALKGWLAREGGVDWSIDTTMADYAKTSGFKIALAQIVKLQPDAKQHEHAFALLRSIDPPEDGIFHHTQMVAEHHWIPVMNVLGQEIRAQRKVG